MKKRPLFLVVGIILIMFFVESVLATDYYVDTGSVGGACSDSNPGTSESNPLCTLHKAEENAQEGDTILVRQGTYTITSRIEPKEGQTWKSYNGEGVTIIGDTSDIVFRIAYANDTTIEGFKIDGAQRFGIYGRLSTNISVLNCEVTDWNKDNRDYSHAIVYVGCIGGRIADNVIYGGNPDTSGTIRHVGGIVMVGTSSSDPEPGIYTGGTIVENNYVYGPDVGAGIWADINSGCINCPGGRHIWRNNVIENTVRSGMKLEIGSTAIIEGNIIIGPGRHGIDVRNCEQQIDGLEVVNNVFYEPNWFGIWISENDLPACPGTKATNLLVKNNIFYLNNSLNAINVHSNSANEPSNIFTHNLFFNTNGKAPICWNQPTGDGSLQCQTGSGAVEYSSSELDIFHEQNGGSGSIWGDPLFENPPYDFHLQEGSPACGTGEGGVNMGAYPYSGCGGVSQLPYNGPHNIPGRIEAEDYDTGGEGVAYHDYDTGNNGGHYRSDDVDIKLSNDSSGGGIYTVGWMHTGDWLEYTIDVLSDADYTFYFRVLSQETNAQFHVEMDSVNVTGIQSVPYTGQWDTDSWITMQVSDVPLTAGQHIMRMFVDQSYFDLNYIEIYMSTCGNADTNSDNFVSMVELMSYIADWKAGSVQMTQLMTAIGEWKNGCS